MAGNVDEKRYQIISLLYIVFICFSVISIKISLLDSNIYTIRSLDGIQLEELKKVEISNKIIQDNITLLEKSEKAKSYLKISNHLADSSKVIDSLLLYIDDQFEEEETSILKQFNSKNLITKTLSKENGIKVLQKNLFNLDSIIQSSKHNLDSLPTSLRENIPIIKTVKTIKGKEESWEDYLFLKKPTAISYMQLIRIKLLITKSRLIHQEAALKEIGYLPTYFSPFNPKLYVLKSEVKIYEEEEILKPDQKAVNIDDVVLDDFFKNLLNGLNTENIYVGIQVKLINNKNKILGDNVKVEVIPRVEIKPTDSTIDAVFMNEGKYLIRFIDKRNSSNTILFEKRFQANNLPDPSVKLSGYLAGNYEISKDDLLKVDRLQPNIEINNLNFFPGRLNQFVIHRISNGVEEESFKNYGEVFQPQTQSILGNVSKNDIIIFDQIRINLLDKTTRQISPLIYKVNN